MACESYIDLIDKYVDGFVTTGEKEVLERHLKICPYCLKEVKLLQQVIKSTNSVERIDLPESFLPELSKSLNSITQRKPTERTSSLVGLARNVATFISRFYHSNRRVFTAVIGVFIIGILVVTTYNLGIFGVNYATKNAKDEAISESAPAAPQEPSTMMNRANVSGQSEGDHEAGEIGITKESLKAFSANERVQKIIKNANMSIYVEQFDEKVDAVIKLVDDFGGYVENSQIQGKESKDSSRRAHIALRIPQARLSEALDEFKAMGRVSNQHMSGENITDVYYDTDVRVRNLVQQEKRLLEILNIANNVDEILRIESELNRVRTDIEILTGQLMSWDKMVEMSLVDLQLIEQEPSKEKIGSLNAQELAHRVKQGFTASVNFTMSLLAYSAEIFGALLPILITGGLLFYIVKKVLDKKKKS